MVFYIVTMCPGLLLTVPVDTFYPGVVVVTHYPLTPKDPMFTLVLGHFLYSHGPSLHCLGQF